MVCFGEQDIGRGLTARSVCWRQGVTKRVSASVHQVIISRIEEHSKKPQEARERIVKLMGDVPKIELFARQKVDGWDVWGNEVDCDVELNGVGV